MKSVLYHVKHYLTGITKSVIPSIITITSIVTMTTMYQLYMTSIWHCIEKPYSLKIHIVAHSISIVPSAIEYWTEYTIKYVCVWPDASLPDTNVCRAYFSKLKLFHFRFLLLFLFLFRPFYSILLVSVFGHYTERSKETEFDFLF